MGGTEQTCSTFYGAGNLSTISSAFGTNKKQTTELSEHKNMHNYVYSV